MPAFLGGGDMIRDVRLDGFTPNDVPWKFEAGTPPIAEVDRPGRRHRLPRGPRHGTRCASTRWRSTAYALRTSPSASATTSPSTARRPAEPRAACSRFAFRDVHPHDLSQVLDQRDVCVRAGHHCAKPLMRLLGVGATARASLYVYNDESDVDALADALERGRRLLRPLDASPRTPPCPASKTCTARSSSTTTATPATAASSRRPPAHRVEGFNPLCGDEIVVYLDVRRRRGRRHPDQRPGLLDQPVLGVDDVGRGQGQDGRRGRAT